MVSRHWRDTMRTTLLHLLLLDGETGDEAFGVVGEADAVHAVGGLELTGRNELGLGVAGDFGTVDGARNLVTLHRKRDQLLDRLILAWGLVNRGARGAFSAVHLEGSGTESAHDEVAVAVSGAIEICLLIGAHVVTGDEYAVRMRVVVERHVLGLAERRADGVVAACLVRRIPVGDGGAGRHVESVAVLGELGVVEGRAALGGAGV